MDPRLTRGALLLGVALAQTGCTVDAAPAGLRPTPQGDGATVVFDLSRRPLPEIPVPNDVATVADPTSRTGVRLNVSLSAKTRLERVAREGFDAMEGWGTFAPITVAFTPSIASPEGAPALDLDELRGRMQGDGWDLSNDAVYLVNLATGVPVPLDLGDGLFPVTHADPSLFWANDVRKAEQNLLFETVEEGPGLGPRQYRPELDTDFDGVLDHPNTLGPLASGAIPGIDDLLTWYERETDTLILRPILPLEEKTEYAVVLTDRLRGSDGKPVRSPFPYIHHPQQKTSVARLAGILQGGAQRAYYGDLAGTGLDHVAFAWTFTTQPVYEDLRLLRDGLYGRGPFARLAGQYPPQAKAFRAMGLFRDDADEPPDLARDARCANVAKHPFVVRIDDARDALHQLLTQLLGQSGPTEQELERAIADNIDHLVIGSFEAPYYLGDPEHEDPDGRFRLNFKTGEGEARSNPIQFWLAVPRRTAAAKAPFDTVMWSHGTAQSAVEIILRAGYFARNHLATMGINMPGHGLPIDDGLAQVAEAFLRPTCMVPWVNAVSAGRARDLNGDGVVDPGGLLWTAHIFHSRDNVRQSVLDQIAATRVVRAFDGRAGVDDTDGDGAPNPAGDFDGDGTPDVGGPGVKLYASGDSYGGMVAMIHGALDPFITGTAAISGGGALTDVAVRSALVPDSVMEQVLTPLVVAIPPNEAMRDKTGAALTVCAQGERSVRFVVNDLVDSAEVEIACLRAGELDEGQTVVVTNVASGEVRCGRTWEGGRFRVPLPASIGDRVDVQIYAARDAVDSYRTCKPKDGAPAGRRIFTWEKPAARFKPVADDRTSCDAVDQGQGCVQFRDVFYRVGSPLVAPNEGLGYRRQSPDLRRLMNLTQAAIDPGDPVNFAPYYMMRPIPGLDGEPLPPRPLLIADTVGDPFVPVGDGEAFARAAGALPFLPSAAAALYPEYAEYAAPQPLEGLWGGKTPMQVLVDAHAVESLARMGRTRGGPSCKVNYRATSACTSPPTDPQICSQTLFDPDWHAEGADLYDAPHLAAPLRLARVANASARADPARAWAPRLNGWGKRDGAAWTADAPVVGLVNAYINPVGQHVWTFGDPCKAFDDAVYYDHVLGRFFASRGQDVYFLSHPESHRCMADQSCPFLNETK